MTITQEHVDIASMPSLDDEVACEQLYACNGEPAIYRVGPVCECGSTVAIGAVCGHALLMDAIFHVIWVCDDCKVQRCAHKIAETARRL